MLKLIIRINFSGDYMLKKRGAGVLLHISSMPSPYAVGVFDQNVKHFIDVIADMGFTYWQVLPFNPLDGANSPYCSPSAFAGNYLFIDPKGLCDMGLVSESDVKDNIYTDVSENNLLCFHTPHFYLYIRDKVDTQANRKQHFRI